MKTRQDYLNGKCSRSEYYSQFVNKSIKKLVANSFGEKLFKSTDKHLNDIPLAQWDNLTYFMSMSVNMKEFGDYRTLSGNVCILKEAARQIINESKK